MENTIREQAAKALDSLFGEENNVADISIKRLLDTFEEFSLNVANAAYVAGNNDGADGVNKVAQYLKDLRK